MGTAIIKIKIMPDDPKTNLDEIEKKAKEIISKSTISRIKSEKEPIAFGLVALYLIFAFDEEKSTDEMENSLRKLPHVSSAEIVDFRRALG